MKTFWRIPVVFALVFALALSLTPFAPFGCGGGGGDDGSSGTEEPSPFFNGENTIADSSATPVVLTLADGTKVLGAPDELLLEFSEDATVAEMIAVQSAITANGVTLVGEEPDLKMLQLRIDPARMNELIALFEAMSGVSWVSPNVVLGPDDHSPFPVNLLDSSDFWRNLTKERDAEAVGSSCDSVPIGVVDSGVNLSTGWFDRDKVEIVAYANSNANESRLDDTSSIGHGTKVTGLMAGLCTKNPFYIAKPQWHSDYWLWGAGALNGISRVLTEFGARKGVVNVSQGTGITRAEDGRLYKKVGENEWMEFTVDEANRYRQLVRKTMTGALRLARQKDALVVMSAGNDGITDSQRLPPGSTIPQDDWENYAINVGSLSPTRGADGIPGTEDDGLVYASTSRRGPNVDLYAPADGIGVINQDSTKGATNEYTTDSGTSLAAPQVTAAAAMMRCANPSLTAPEIRRILIDSATPTMLEDGSVVPMLNVRNALIQAMARVPGNGITVRGHVTNRSDPGDPLVGGALIRAQLVNMGGDDVSITTVSAATAIYSGGYNYQISIPFTISDVGTMPTFIVLNCTHEDFQPMARSVNTTLDWDFYFQDFPLIQGSYVLIDGALHHVGDGNFTGTANSQFQMPAEGTHYTGRFDLGSEPTTFTSATLHLSHRGAEDDNGILMNLNYIGLLNNSPYDGSMAIAELPFDISTLNPDTANFLEFQSAMDGTGDYDDFEFTNLFITFSN